MPMVQKQKRFLEDHKCSVCGKVDKNIGEHGNGFICDDCWNEKLRENE